MIEPIVFKLTKDGFHIMITKKMDFEEIKKNLTEKFEKSEDFFDGTNLKTTIKGKEFNKAEFEELKEIIKKNTEFTEIIQEVPVFDWKNNLVEGETKFHIGTLRSGYGVKYEGNIVIIGDVNPGAEIKATGNVIITGYLKGMVHAGMNGNESAMICARGINPIQIRIADVITVPPNKNIEKSYEMEKAYIKDGNIYIEKI